MVTADAVVIDCPQGCVLQMAALPQPSIFFENGNSRNFPKNPLVKWQPKKNKLNFKICFFLQIFSVVFFCLMFRQIKIYTTFT